MKWKFLWVKVFYVKEGRFNTDGFSSAIVERSFLARHILHRTWKRWWKRCTNRKPPSGVGKKTYFGILGICWKKWSWTNQLRWPFPVYHLGKLPNLQTDASRMFCQRSFLFKETMHLYFHPWTVFRKADASRDDRVSFPEFERIMKYRDSVWTWEVVLFGSHESKFAGNILLLLLWNITWEYFIVVFLGQENEVMCFCTAVAFSNLYAFETDSNPHNSTLISHTVYMHIIYICMYICMWTCLYIYIHTHTSWANTINSWKSTYIYVYTRHALRNFVIWPHDSLQ